MSETQLTFTKETENKEPPKILIGIGDQRRKIGTDVELYVKGVCVCERERRFYSSKFGMLFGSNMYGLSLSQMQYLGQLSMQTFRCTKGQYLIHINFQNKRAQQRLINLEIPVLVRSLKSSNVELG